MYQYRVTKYNPKFRSLSGAYTKAEWTSISDVGKTIAGHLVTQAEYALVESAYVASALDFLDEAGVSSLAICGLENHRSYPVAFSEGMQLGGETLAIAFQDVLRENYWCRFERATEAFVHFGYDYYMYLGTGKLCAPAIERAHRRGLFVEEYESPYHPKDDD